MRVAIGSDHGGFQLKKQIIDHLRSLDHDVDDVGTDTSESVDYPDFAQKVCKLVQTEVCTRGILICGTGIGMSMAANRLQHIRAALCHDHFTAKMSREHNDANVLCLGERVIGSGVAEEIVDVWMQTAFAGGRHQRRIDKF